MEHTFVEWLLFRSGTPRVPGSCSSALLDGWGDLEEREKALGIEPGRPFLLRPDYSPDLDVLRYFGSAAFRKLAPLSQLGYARNLRVFLSHLESQGVAWREATEEDLLNYEHWRRRDDDNDERLLGGATFARELAAFRHFFEWQSRRGTIGRSPVTLTTVRRRDGTFGTAARIRPFNVRKWEVKWLLPEAYWLWRDVGLRGYTRDGLPESSRRERNDQRNVAFADTLWMSGLRRREAGTLLVQELPPLHGYGRLPQGRVGEAVAKGGGRKFWVSRPALQSIDGYVLSSRAKSVRRAQAEGRYDNVPGLMVALKVNARRHLVYRDEHGHEGTVALDLLDASQRRKVFVERHGELEPAMVWLTQAGMPMAYDSWKMMFQTANRRCAAQGLEDLRCYAHMLRHSCAPALVGRRRVHPRPSPQDHGRAAGRLTRRASATPTTSSS